jgi:hypothetical protein
VQGVAAKADIVLKRADVELQRSRQSLDWNIANMQRVTSHNAAQLNVIQARLAAFQAVTSRSSAKYEADRSARVTELQAQVSLSQVSIAKYQVLLEQWKTRAQEIVAFAQISAESLRAAGQMASNVASGALAGTHVSAGLSASTSAGQSTSRSSTSASSQNKNVSENDNYSVVHQYNHRV